MFFSNFETRKFHLDHKCMQVHASHSCLQIHAKSPSRQCGRPAAWLHQKLSQFVNVPRHLSFKQGNPSPSCVLFVIGS